MHFYTSKVCRKIGWSEEAGSYDAICFLQREADSKLTDEIIDHGYKSSCLGWNKDTLFAQGSANVGFWPNIFSCVCAQYFLLLLEKKYDNASRAKEKKHYRAGRKTLILALRTLGSGFTSKGGQNWWVTIFLSCPSSKNTTTTTASLSENNSIFKLMHYKPMTLNSLSCFFFSPS